MKNMPYSTPKTKTIARKQVKRAIKAQKKSSLSPFLYFFILPLGIFGLYATGIFSNPLVLSAYQGAREALFEAKTNIEPYIETATNNIKENEIVNREFVRPFRPLTLEKKSEAAQAVNNDVVALPLDYVTQNYTKDDFLNDRMNRIPDIFRISNSFKPRVGFWFDIYTRYSSVHHVLHHVDYPWIIFKVIDTTKVLSGPEHKWTKYHKAQALVKKEIQSLRMELAKLSRVKNLSLLNDEQRRYADLLAQIPGKNIQAKFARAANKIRTQLGQKDFYKKGLENSAKYLPHMEEIFAQYDLPVELTRLPLVESSFNENAISKVGASGIWQFMPYTGKLFLKITDGIDERNSPLKATEAAAKLMLQNFRITKNWPMAITAYNHGPGGILKASRASNSKDLPVIIERFSSERFGFASSNFFASFLAALHGERYQEEIFGQLVKPSPHKSDTIKLTRAFKAKVLSQIVGITMEELKLYNPDLKSKHLNPQMTLPVGFRVFVPAGRKARMELYVMELKEQLARKKQFKKQARNNGRLRVSADERWDKSSKM